MVGKKSVIIIIFIIGVLISIIIFEFLFDSRDQKSTPDHIFIINYSYQNPSEWEAINVSENLDYENILNIPRYDEQWGQNNFIDITVINDFTSSYDNPNVDYDTWFEYRAKAQQIKNSTLRYSFENEKVFISLDNYSIISNDERERYGWDFNPIVAGNSQGDFEILNNSQDLNIINLNGIIIEMSLKRGSHIGGPDSYHDSYVKQIVILDKNFNPIYVIRIISNAVMS